MIKTLYDQKNEAPTKSIADGKSVYISQERYNGILRHLTRKAEIEEQREKEKKFQEYLKNSSHAFTEKWTNTVEAQMKKKQEERRKKEEDHVLDGERRFKALTEADEKKRSEFIGEIEEVLKKIKIGPRQLESATRMTEVFQAQELQRKLNKEQRQIEQQRAFEDARDVTLQAKEWLLEHKNEIVAARQRTEKYKKEIFQTIQDNHKSRQEEMQQTLAEEKMYRDDIVKDLEEQADRDRMAEKKRKELHRQFCQETIKLAKDRETKMKQQDAVQNKIDYMYREGQHALTKKFKAHQKDLMDQRLINCAKTKIPHVVLEPTAEQTMKAQEEIKQKMIQREVYDKIRNKKLKEERIQAHRESLEQARKLKNREMEEKRWDIANRLKNVEVHAEFDKQKRLKIANQNKELYRNFDKQIREKEETARALREQDINYVKNNNVRNLDDDKYFMNYANVLMEDTRNKGRTILPIQRAVERYRKQNYLDVTDSNADEADNCRNEAKHLKSHIKIGCGDAPTV